MAIAEPVVEMMKGRVLAFLGGTLDLAVPTARIAEDIAALAVTLGRDPFWRPRLGAAGRLLAERREAEAESAKELVANFLAGIAREEAAAKAAAIKREAHSRYLRRREGRREEDRRRSVGAGSGKK